MKYMKQKIELYKQITGLPWVAMGVPLKCNYARFKYLFPRRHNPRIKQDLLWRYDDLLVRIRQHFKELDRLCKTSKPFTTYWPELFIPELPGVSELIPEGYQWFAITDEDTSRIVTLDIPYWPFSQESGILIQTEDGWVKKSPLILDPYTIQVVGKAHIPGNFDPTILELIKTFRNF